MLKAATVLFGLPAAAHNSVDLHAVSRISFRPPDGRELAGRPSRNPGSRPIRRPRIDETVQKQSRHPGRVSFRNLKSALPH